MTDTQKKVVAVGLALLAISTAYVPYRVTFHQELQRLLGRGGEPYTVTRYRPLWSPPTASNVNARPGNDFDSAALDAGKMGLVWAGIVIVTVAATALAAPSRTAGP